MPASAPFKVHNILLSEYSTQDSEGKPILIGMHTGSVHFRETPPVLPPWFLTAIIQPLVTEFSCEFNIDGPSGRNILKVHFDHKADIVGGPGYRLILNVQLPTIPFPGDGDYQVRIKDQAGGTLFRHSFTLQTGLSQAPRAQVNARAEINTEFMRRKPAEAPNG